MISHEAQHKFAYSWPVITLGNWQKYPNPYSTHVLSVDVISRHINKNGELVTDRLLQMKQPIPSLFKKLGLPFPEVSFFFERSILNRETQVLKATSYSLSMRSLFRAEELCSYNADPSTGGTLFIQKANFTAFSFFSSLIEEIAINRFIANAGNGKLGLESAIHKVINSAESFALGAFEEAKQIESKLEMNVKETFYELETTLEKVGNEAKETMSELDKEFGGHISRVFEQDYTKVYNPFLFN
jgi:hypothetical protein